MNPYLTSIILFLVWVGVAIGAFFLVRSAYWTFREKKITKGVGFSLAAFLVIIIALTLIVSGVGWLIIALR